MPATYTYSGDPTTSTKDAVRYKLNDTGPYPAGSSSDPTGWDFADQEIEFEIDGGGSVSRIASRMARTLAAKYMKQPSSKKVGDLTIVNSLYLKGKEYLALADALEMETEKRTTDGTSMFAGGVSLPGKQANAQNSGLTKPDFRKDMFDRGQTKNVGLGYPPYTGDKQS